MKSQSTTDSSLLGIIIGVWPPRRNWDTNPRRTIVSPYQGLLKSPWMRAQGTISPHTHCVPVGDRRGEQLANFMYVNRNNWIYGLHWFCPRASISSVTWLERFPATLDWYLQYSSHNLNRFNNNSQKATHVCRLIWISHNRHTLGELSEARQSKRRSK